MPMLGFDDGNPHRRDARHKCAPSRKDNCNGKALTIGVGKVIEQKCPCTADIGITDHVKQFNHK